MDKVLKELEYIGAYFHNLSGDGFIKYATTTKKKTMGIKLNNVISLKTKIKTSKKGQYHRSIQTKINFG